MLQPKYDIYNEVYFTTYKLNGFWKGRIIAIHISFDHIGYTVRFYSEEADIMDVEIGEKDLYDDVQSLMQACAEELSETLARTDGVPKRKSKFD